MSLAHQIDHFFAHHGSPVAGLGNLFVQYGAKYGVDPRLVAAIVMKETEGGLTGTGRPGQYNLTGVGGVGHMRSYPNYGASIADTARNLGSPRYRGKPLNVQTAMWVAGTPPSASTAPYTRDVQNFLGMLGGGANAVSAPTSMPTMPKAPRLPSSPSLPDPTALLQQLGEDTGVPWMLPSLKTPDLPGQPPIPGSPGKVIGKAGNLPIIAGGKAGPLEQKAVALIQHYLGVKYVTGGRSGPAGGFDCSGLVQYVYGKLGVKLGNTTYDQIKQGRPVKFGQLQPGDIVFFYGPNPHHEGLYLGNGKFIHAPHTGDVVKISDLSSGYYRQNFWAARRVA